MYALIKKLSVASKRGHLITELPASRERIEDGNSKELENYSTHLMHS